MRILLLFGLVAVALADVTRFDGEQVLRLKPIFDEHVTLIKDLAQSIEIDFWSPESAELVTIDIDVDIRVPALYQDMVHTMLLQSNIQHEVLIDDLQAAVEDQADNKASPRTHSYTKYNSWDKVRESDMPYVCINTIPEDTTCLRQACTRSMKPNLKMEIISKTVVRPQALSTYGKDSQMTSLLDQMDVYVLPVFNIDGYDYTHKSNRMWRKTRSRRSGSSCVGADPNRNWNAGWCTIGASSSPCSDTFCGYKPESEIEVKNVADFIRRNKSAIKAYITIHSYSQLLLFPYSYTYDLAAHHSELLKIAQGASAALRRLYGTRYTSGPGAATIYPAAGGSDDWAYDLGVKYSFTFELRDTGRYGFLLPESQIKPTCEETMLAVKYIAAYVQKNLY
uniref:Carboxypeptidase B n=1 Tax=Hippocampus comes TaxID=109280 RepID=A0A3Q2XWA0_HIPCM